MLHNQDRISTIKRLRDEGQTLRSIGLIFGITHQRVDQILNDRKRHYTTSGRELTRTKVRSRDNNTCRSCGKVWKEGKRRFDVHHLGGLCGRLSRAYDKIESIDRLITLCHKCHLNLPEVREKMQQKSSPRPGKALPY